MPLKLKKYDGITALDTAHPLYSKVDRFILFDTTIKDLKAGQVYTSSAATIADDVPLGANIRQFDATADAISPNVPIPFPCTIMFIYRQYGSNSLGGGDTSMIRLSSGDMLILDAGNWGGYDYRLTRRGNFGSVFETNYKVYRDGLDWSTQQATVTARRQQAHCLAIDYVSGASGFCHDGITRSPDSGATAPVFTPSANPISAQLAAIVSSGKEWNLAGFVVFNTVLTTAEKESITQEPWELTNGYEALEASISAAPTPGATITTTLLNYPSLPTSVTIVDSRGNDLVLPLTATGATTATFTVPALASSTAGQEYVQYGAVNLTFGAKTISSTFAPVSPVGYETLVAPVATNAFEAWGPDVPVAGEQLSSQGNFDVYGNFTGADPEAVYTCWITRLNGANYRFTVQQGDADPPEPAPGSGSNISRSMFRDVSRGVFRSVFK